MKKTTVNLKFPTQFAKFIDHTKEVEFEGESVSEFMNHLDKVFGNISTRILESDGTVRPYINLFIGKKNINSLDGLNSVIPNGESFSLLLSRAGG